MVRKALRRRRQAQIVARIDSEPLLTIGDQPENALFRVIDVALVGDALIVAEMKFEDAALLRSSHG